MQMQVNKIFFNYFLKSWYCYQRKREKRCLKEKRCCWWCLDWFSCLMVNVSKYVWYDSLTNLGWSRCYWRSQRCHNYRLSRIFSSWLMIKLIIKKISIVYWWGRWKLNNYLYNCKFYILLIYLIYIININLNF